MIGTLSSKGQLTIPNRIRKQLGLKAGDKVSWSVTDQGEIKVTPIVRSVIELGGCLRHLAKDKPVTVDEMNRAIEEAVAAKHEGRRR